ncbi:MAG: aconitate hydratase [Chloroflexi bacterium]|nr:MAG: aconitate hydratase [Chloroflexota bacterium]
MALNVSQKLIKSHLLEGEMNPGEMIGIRIDQTLTQDATGTLVMLELEAMGLRRVRTEVSVQYVDHNLIQTDFKNPDDHLFLQSACERFGVWFSRPGNGVSHPVHMQHFGKPGKTLLGSDSHTPAAGSLGMLAIGAGGLDVAMAMAGHPFYLTMPKIWGVKLTGKLPDWVSAKDVILELLRRHTVRGGVGHVIEYYGPGLKELSAMDRHVIANMGTELGATSTVFPSDETIREFLREQERGEDWIELVPDPGAEYDRREEIDLSTLEPLIAKPSSPDAVVPVRELAGMPIYQSYIGSSANPGYRDFAIVAQIVKDRRVANNVSFDINPTSRQLLEELIAEGEMGHLIHAGARLHQAGCNGCIGMGQAPASGKVSLRTVPRNFPGRSGTKEDQVYLCSPETAAASALTGVITDPRELGIPYPKVKLPKKHILNKQMLIPPLPEEQAVRVELVKGPNIQLLPPLDLLPERLEMPILLKVGDNISTDEIMPAGARVLPYRSNIPKISEFVFENIDPTYDQRALERTPPGSHAIIAGENYGQGSSREHAAIAPRYLGLRMVIAKSFARIHRMNLVNFGILPVIFEDPTLYSHLELEDVIVMENAREQLVRSVNDRTLILNVPRKKLTFLVHHNLFPRMIEVLLAGGLTNWTRDKAPVEKV